MLFRQMYLIVCIYTPTQWTKENNCHFGQIPGNFFFKDYEKNTKKPPKTPKKQNITTTKKDCWFRNTCIMY